MVNKLQATINTYNHIAKKFSQKNFAESFWMPEFTLFQKLLPQGKVLEIGSGAGRDSLLFTKNKYEYIGFDASIGMLRVAKKRNPKARFIESSFYDFKFPQNSFDGFWASASLLHVPKKRINSVLKRLLRVLKPGGIGLITMKEKLHLDEGVITDGKYDEPIERFFAFYTKSEFIKVLQFAGFQVLELMSKTDSDHPETNWLSFFVQKPYSVQLVLPSVKYKKSYIQSYKEFARDQMKNSESESYRNLALKDFPAFIKMFRDGSKGKNLQKGWVPFTEYWLVDGDKYIGRVNIRHKLNTGLKKLGGHIGYSIRPSERNKGYGKLILALGLEKAKALGIKKAMLTCDITNTASRKIIEANGGKQFSKGDGKYKFWINNK